MTASVGGAIRSELRQVTGEQFASLVSVDDAREAVRTAYIGFSEGRFIEPPRTVADSGRFISMSCIDRETQEVAVKSMTIRHENLERKVPSHNSVVLVFDRDGVPVGVIDGNAVTIRRTGAASGVATDLLAEPNSTTLAVLGAGSLAAEQVDAVMAVRPIRNLRVHSLDHEASERLATLASQAHPGLCAVVSDTAENAVRDADVVCCVTNSTKPLFDVSALSSTVHINAIGSYRPEMIELPPEFTIRATVVVDNRTAVAGTSGDIIKAAALDEGLLARLVEIGAVLHSPPARSGPTCFKSVGIAAQDLVVARVALARALADPMDPGKN